LHAHHPVALAVEVELGDPAALVGDLERHRAGVGRRARRRAGAFLAV
jgi:hypothetical protein